MRIAIWHNLPSGGGKRALYDQVKGLVQRGHYIESWCPPTADQSYWPLSDLVKEHILPILDGRKSYPQYLVDSPNYVGLLMRSLQQHFDTVNGLEAMNSHCLQCAKQISDDGFDLLLAGACTFFRTSPIAHYLDIPKVIYLGEPYRWLYEALPKLPWLAMEPPRRFWWSPRYLRSFIPNLIEVQARRVQAREELANARAFDSILVNSYYSRESVLRAYGLDAKVCYLGIDTERFVDRGEARANFIVGVGALAPDKNIQFVLRALSLLPHPRPRLVWIGNTFLGSEAYISELKAQAQAADIDFEIRLNVSDDELIDALNRALVMVYAPRLEPFGLAPLEANACGLPVVAVAEGGVRETIRDGVNGLLVEPQPAAFAAGLQRLLADREYALELGRAARAYVVSYWSIDSALDRLEQKLLEAVDSRAGLSNVQVHL